MITVIALNHGPVVNPRSPRPYFMFSCIAADDAGRNRWPDLDRARIHLKPGEAPASGHRRNDVSPHRILRRRTLLRVRHHPAHRAPQNHRRASHAHPTVSHANGPRSTRIGHRKANETDVRRDHAADDRGNRRTLRGTRSHPATGGPPCVVLAHHASRRPGRHRRRTGDGVQSNLDALRRPRGTEQPQTHRAGRRRGPGTRMGLHLRRTPSRRILKGLPSHPPPSTACAPTARAVSGTADHGKSTADGPAACAPGSSTGTAANNSRNRNDHQSKTKDNAAQTEEGT